MSEMSDTLVGLAAAVSASFVLAKFIVFTIETWPTPSEMDEIERRARSAPSGQQSKLPQAKL